MPYIASLIRSKNKNQKQAAKLEAPKVESPKIEFFFTGSLVEAVNDFASTPPTPRVRPFQLDYQTWHARLEGWNPVQPRKTVSEVDISSSDEMVAKAA
jgi:hypothetical protein